MKIKVPQTILVEKYICELCGEQAKADGSFTFIRHPDNRGKEYTPHYDCLIKLVEDKLSPSNP